MTSSPDSGLENHSDRPLSPGGFQRLSIQILVVILFVGCGVWGVLWWQEKPLRTAQQQMSAGELDAAFNTLTEFLHEYPDHQLGLALKARILVAEGQPRQAINLFERVGASEPEDLHAWAKALLQLEQWSNALPLLEVVDRSGIDRADVLHELAACRMKLGEAEGALQAAEEFSKQPGCEARGQLLVGTIHQQRGNLRQASAAWERVFKASPEGADLQIAPAEFFLEFGRVKLALGDPKAAEAFLERSLKLRPDVQATVSLGETQYQLGKIAEAQKSFESALQEDQSSATARKGLANIALAAGDAPRAIELLTPLDKPDALTSEIAFLLQRSYTRLKDESAAKLWQTKAETLRKEESIKDAADQILRDTPDSDWAAVIRAYKYADQGNWGEAESIIKSLGQTSQSQPFIRDLSEAVKARGKLPSLLDLPVRDH